MNTQPAVIVLAAGRGSRFLGSDHKLAQRLGSATVLGATLRHAVASQLPVVVVTTEAFADLARRSIAARDVVVLPEVGRGENPLLGMGYSIGAGVGARPEASGWIVLPGSPLFWTHSSRQASSPGEVRSTRTPPSSASRRRSS